jgi:hypothetical protein
MDSDAERATEEINYYSASLVEVGQMVTSSVGGLGADAFEQYYEAMDRVIDGQAAFGKSSGRAAQAAVGGTMRSLGQQAAVQATFELALAAAAGTSGFFGKQMYGSPGEHLKSAALFGAVAVAAGAAGAGLSVQGMRGGESGSGPMRMEGRNGPTFRITVVGSLDDEAAGTLLQRLESAADRHDA